MRQSIRLIAVLALSVVGPLCVLMLNNEAAAQTADLYANIVVLDIKPAETAKFLELARKNSAAAVKQPGCRVNNVAESKSDPNHIVLFEVYDSEAAFNAHLASDQFKQYQATIDGMVEKSTARGQSVIALNSKGHSKGA